MRALLGLPAVPLAPSLVARTRRHTYGAIAPLLALLMGVPAVAAAENGQSFRSFDNYCTTGTLVSCASVQLFAVTSASGTVLTIRILNLQGTLPQDNTGGSSIGYLRFATPCSDPTCSTPDFLGMGGPVAVGSAQPIGPAPEIWDATLGNPGALAGYLTSELNPAGGAPSGIVGCSSLDALASYYQTCGAGGWVEVTLSFSNQFSADEVAFLWATYTYPDGDPNNSGPGYSCSFGAAYGPTTCAQATVTPEPVTLTLLGTGLAGMGLARRRRRAG